jgi:hypothetical protein
MIKIIGADNCKYGVDNYDDIDDGRIDDDDNKEEDDDDVVVHTVRYNTSVTDPVELHN